MIGIRELSTHLLLILQRRSRSISGYFAPQEPTWLCDWITDVATDTVGWQPKLDRASFAVQRKAKSSLIATLFHQILIHGFKLAKGSRKTQQ
jgi:hypothetical protein